MADDDVTQQQSKSGDLVSQVLAERKKAKRDAAKSKIKSLIEELEKADEVRTGIMTKIEDILADINEPSGLSNLMAG